ncbi:dopamine beta-hydroxylase-like [Babylonia areolata]|uniref:dopamine beta-hydroxylase-like n=1 Tax=Babylonia areolata TaxID=304850 RepID=UPI003FD236DC
MKKWEEGWLGVGFSDYGDISDADVAVFWTDEDGWHHFQDGWTDKDGYLYIDTQQDYYLMESTITDDVTTLAFSRKFDTCDDEDYVFDNGTTHIVYFTVRGRPGGVTATCLSREPHGLTRVQLLKPDLPDVTLPDDVWTFDVTAPRVHVPSNGTTYWWYVTRLPPLRHKHHIIKYEAVVEEGHEGLVHHMELFHCDAGPGRQVPLYSGPGEAERVPPALQPCQHVLGAWAMGAEAMVYPEEAGVPIGGEDFSRFVLLEVHYNNPQHLTGLVDSSGMRFHVTRKLRAHDAGIMQLGLTYTDKMAIPPRQRMFTLTGYCTQQCTEAGLPPSGVTAFASQLHTHLTGKRVRTRHLRAGVELPEINRDDHYSPHYQEIRRLPFPRVVLPGDELVTSCDDSTLDRDHVTVGGLSIQQEMCVNYVHYYPRVQLEVCKSSVDTVALGAFFTFMKEMENQSTSRHNTPSQNYEAIRWTPLNVRLLTSLYQGAPLSMQCEQSDGRRFPGQWDKVPPPAIQHPLKKPQRPFCVRSAVFYRSQSSHAIDRKEMLVPAASCLPLSGSQLALNPTNVRHVTAFLGRKCADISSFVPVMCGTTAVGPACCGLFRIVDMCR